MWTMFQSFPKDSLTSVNYSLGLSMGMLTNLEIGHK